MRVAAASTLAIGLTAAVVPLATAAAGPSVNRTGYITISGGVKLAYDLTLPSATGRFPVALEYNDYTAGADNSAHQRGSDAGDLLAAGFAVLGVNQPGSGCSGGVNNIADVGGWGRAGAQVVQWAARQPWSTGHVGMFGSSWTGITQLGAASFRPRGLDAITPFHVASDLYRDVGYPGGVYNSAFINMYAAGLVRIDRQAAQAGISRGNKQCIKDFRMHVPLNQKYSIARTCSPTRSTTATTKPHRARVSAASTSRSWAASPGRTAWCHHGQPSCITTPSSGPPAGSSA